MRQSGIAVDKLSHNWFFALAYTCKNLFRRFPGRRLGDEDNHGCIRIFLQKIDGLKHRNTAHFCTQVTSANADGVADAAAQLVDNVHDLLHAAAAGSGNPDRAAAHLAAQTDSRTADEAKAAVGPHHQ